MQAGRKHKVGDTVILKDGDPNETYRITQLTGEGGTHASLLCLCGHKMGALRYEGLSKLELMRGHYGS